MGNTGAPYDALLQLAQPSDIEPVAADGRILHRNRKFTAPDYDRLLAEGAQSVAAQKTKAKWT